MAESTCTVEGCTRRPRSRGWCANHYARWRRTGDPIGTGDKAVRPPTCTIAGCGRKHCARGWCAMHYDRWRHTGDPMVVRRSGRPRVPDEQTSYEAVHLRMRRAYGTPTSCVRCGSDDVDGRYEWALDWRNLPTDVIRVEADGPRAGSTYSTDPAHYIALCVDCHRSYDLGTSA